MVHCQLKLTLNANQFKSNVDFGRSKATLGIVSSSLTTQFQYKWITRFIILFLGVTRCPLKPKNFMSNCSVRILVTA